MGKKSPEHELPLQVPKTLDEFKVAVKYVLMNRYGAPELVADALLADDPDYVSAGFDDVETEPEVVLAIAEELTVKPKPGQEWVLRDAAAIIVPSNAAIDSHLARLAELGMYGEDAEEVARQMIVRGLECVLPIVAATTSRR